MGKFDIKNADTQKLTVLDKAIEDIKLLPSKGAFSIYLDEVVKINQSNLSVDSEKELQKSLQGITNAHADFYSHLSADNIKEMSNDLKTGKNNYVSMLKASAQNDNIISEKIKSMDNTVAIAQGNLNGFNMNTNALEEDYMGGNEEQRKIRQTEQKMIKQSVTSALLNVSNNESAKTDYKTRLDKGEQYINAVSEEVAKILIKEYNKTPDEAKKTADYVVKISSTKDKKEKFNDQERSILAETTKNSADQLMNLYKNTDSEYRNAVADNEIKRRLTKTYNQNLNEAEREQLSNKLNKLKDLWQINEENFKNKPGGLQSDKNAFLSTNRDSIQVKNVDEAFAAITKDLTKLSSPAQIIAFSKKNPELNPSYSIIDKSISKLEKENKYKFF